MIKMIVCAYIVCGMTLWVMLELVFLLLRHSPFNWYSVAFALVSYVLYYVVSIKELSRK
jgi:hypothetical protein